MKFLVSYGTRINACLEELQKRSYDGDEPLLNYEALITALKIMKSDFA